MLRHFQNARPAVGGRRTAVRIFLKSCMSPVRSPRRDDTFGPSDSIGGAALEAKVVLGDFLRRTFLRHRSLTIDLIADDRLAIGRAICRLTKAEEAALPWPTDDTQKLYKKLMARNPKGYDGWHPGGVQLVPVSLSIAVWQMIMHLCAHQVVTATNDWPPRMLATIREKLDGNTASPTN